MAVSAQDNRGLLNDDDSSYIHGVFRVEIKEASKIYENENSSHDRLYALVTVLGKTKRTKVVINSYGSACWAQTKHFPVTVQRSKKHIDNLVSIEVIGNSSVPDAAYPDQVVGMVAFHLHDIIKQSPVDGVFDLFNSYQTVGEIKLSLSFSYGLFGYGYSTQLKEEHYNVDHFLKYSLFPRIDPIVGRSDPSKHVLMPKATRHPLFIPFNQRTQLGFGQEIATTLDNIHDNSGKFSLLGKSMDRFNSLQECLKRESSRAEKLNFLSNLLLDNYKKVEAIKEGSEEMGESDKSVSANANASHGTSNFVTLSTEEMKERGLLVVSLPTKEQEKVAVNNENDSATVASSNPVLSSVPSSLNSRPRAGSFRINRPVDAGIVASSPTSSPHSLSTPLLNNSSTSVSPALKHGEMSSPPANPRILNIKLRFSNLCFIPIP